MMQDTASPSKTSVQVSVDTTLLELAAARKLDLTDLLERALLRELPAMATAPLRSAAAEQWRRENADAIRAWNEDVERNGLWSDDLRTF
jgi:antitoxin CcdA